jgi:nuclear pore complex protein Nup93
VNLEKAGSEEYPTFNFAKALALYAKNFIRTSAATSFEYLALITINNDLPPPTNKVQVNAAQEAVRELVLESRDFVTLLGDIRPDGAREPGIIERRGKLLNIEDAARQEYVRSIVEKAATLVDDEGDTSSAVLLYHLSQDYSLVLATINRRLSDVFSDPSAPIYTNDPTAQEETKKMNFSMAAVADPALLASNILAMYDANGSIQQRLDSRERETCRILLTMIDAHKAFLGGRWESCVSVLPKYEFCLIALDY